MPKLAADSLPHLLRDSITNAYRMDETSCIKQLLEINSLNAAQLEAIAETATHLVKQLRTSQHSSSLIEQFMHQYDLSTDEGIIMLSLAEALLRIPDAKTADQLIDDKMSQLNWKFARRAGQICMPLLRPLVKQMMKIMGQQFVLGEDIESALKKAKAYEKKAYLFSYDMLGETARTQEDANRYYAAYVQALEVIGAQTQAGPVEQNPAISVKLSALHPRFEYTQRERVLKELTPRLLTLAQLAKKYHMGLTIDAEEAERLDLTLDCFQQVYQDSSLAAWDGLGLAVQAYQKRARFVIAWLSALAKQGGKRIPLRLVKGAYWDSEIKQAQQLGLSSYPVFTRKTATDISYLVCAQQILAASPDLYPQFATHNAYTVAAILHSASKDTAFEFQCLYGMGTKLYDLLQQQKPCRIYAPIGTYQHLLGYLVRRLLENAANTSFVHDLYQSETPIEKIIFDPFARMQGYVSKTHPHIPLPQAIAKNWQLAAGVDLSNRADCSALQQKIRAAEQELKIATPAVNLEQAISAAKRGYAKWAERSIEERAQCLEKAAQLLQADLPQLMHLLIAEGRKCIADSLAEVREAIDYCRYYAYRARTDLQPLVLPGPTGEYNQLSLHGRGVLACISPWNFPLAIFIGQMTAALVTGNAVIAKPAQQTPRIAKHAIHLLHQAGIPLEVLHCLAGDSALGQALIEQEAISGVLFTGSTATAKKIAMNLAKRSGPLPLFIAETAGQNAMLVDSSALLEQSVFDIAQSAFNSAGQRCSALRVLFVQEDIAPALLTMLKGYLAEWVIGDPQELATDVGPIIDEAALNKLKDQLAKLKKIGKLLAEVPLPPHLQSCYLAPCVFEIPDTDCLREEVFGPILHVIRYKAKDINKVIESIIQMGYGLTFGIQSRINTKINAICRQLPVGNIYVNRNMIGAVVGMQPFGGEGLSGTGPKAGGPHYLPRLCVERLISNNLTAVGGNADLASLAKDDEC
jgi:RHH-type transcriptional regulator, proline utilization regulon repressor / proline dehydrogenase / delta 1-pyrroline-5-carboxylate dehydrogenase